MSGELQKAHRRHLFVYVNMKVSSWIVGSVFLIPHRAGYEEKDSDTWTVELESTAAADDYVAFGVCKPGSSRVHMTPSDAVLATGIARDARASPSSLTRHLFPVSASGDVKMDDFWLNAEDECKDGKGVCTDATSTCKNGVNDLTNISGARTDGIMRARFDRVKVTNDTKCDHPWTGKMVSSNVGHYFFLIPF